MRIWIVAALLATSLLPLGCQQRNEPVQAQRKKNVVLIVLDALRQKHLSTFGYFRPTTPNLDWLAVNGLVVRHLIPTGCATTVSLTSLFTSQPYAHAQLHEGVVLREDNVTLAEIFGSAGYRTAAFVASPVLEREANFDQGFSTYMDFEEVDATRRTADLPITAAIDDLRAHRSEATPFFLYLHLREPHPPWTHESPWLGGHEPDESFFDKPCTYLPSGDELAFLDDHQKADLIAKYDGALRFADDQIGRFLQELRVLGHLDDTIVAVTTTHGIELLDRYAATHAFNPFDEVVRGFLILFDRSASFKDAVAASLQARIFDVGPTLMGMAGVEASSSVAGVDLLQSTRDLPQVAFVHCSVAEVARTLEYKLIHFDFSRLRESRMRLPVGLEEGEKLFALRADPEETADVKGSGAAERAQLRQALQEHRHRLGAAPARLVE